MRKDKNSLDADVTFVDSQEFSELKEFSKAICEKIKIADSQSKDCASNILAKIQTDIDKFIHYYEESSIGFAEAYEEITSLYVFAEIYVTDE